LGVLDVADDVTISHLPTLQEVTVGTGVVIGSQLSIIGNRALKRINIGPITAENIVIGTFGSTEGNSVDEITIGAVNLSGAFAFINNPKIGKLTIGPGTVGSLSLENNFFMAPGLTDLDGIASGFTIETFLRITANSGFTNEYAQETADRLNVPEANRTICRNGGSSVCVPVFHRIEARAG
jgi:hypothetical protein